MKSCNDCKILKALDEFYSHPGTLDGRLGHCKSCHMIRCKKWNEKNKQRKSDYDYLYRNRRSVFLRENHTKYQREMYASDIHKKLKIVLRSRLIAAIKSGQKGGSAVRDLGCSIEEFKAYIASKFKPGMTWDNWGRTGWHLDHILPLSSFDLTDSEQFRRACHYSNLQPLWFSENLKKSNKVL